MRYNFDGFTEKANEALNQAIISAGQMGHTYVGSEHLLLGLLRVNNAVASAVLNKNGVTAQKLEELMRSSIGSGTPTRLSPDYLTPRAKRVIENAMRGCADTGKKYVGTEHLLLGILGEGDNYAIRFINELGADVSALTNDAMNSSGLNSDNSAKQSANENGKSGGKAPTLENSAET